MMLRTVVCLAILVFNTLAITIIPSTGTLEPITVHYNRSLYWKNEYPNPPIPWDDPRVAPPPPGIHPEQVHLTYFTESSVMVSWVTGVATLSPGLVPEYDPQSVLSNVVYGEDESSMDMEAEGQSLTYNYVYDFQGALNYSSGIIHHTLMTDLLPNTRYYYRVGDKVAGVWSKVFSFKTVGPVGIEALPITIGIIGDIGQTYNSSATSKKLLEKQVDHIMHIGDLSYADDHVAGGGIADWDNTPHYPGIQGPNWGTFQPRWDTWARLMEPVAASIPWNNNNGNHEVERQSDGREFVSYIARYPNPHAVSGSNNPLYYSYEITGAHIISLSNYIDYDKGSPQYQWLEKDLASVDRRKTPWLIVTFHAPVYNTYDAHYKENECMRLAIEDLMYTYSVDLVYSGHVHAYERTNPVYNYKVDDCGPVYTTIGDGGNIEAMYTSWVSKDRCPEVRSEGPWYEPQFCNTFQNGKYCPDAQPPWSAYREPSYGHGELVLHNATTATWSWFRNQDGIDIAADTIVYVRNYEYCQQQQQQQRFKVIYK